METVEFDDGAVGSRDKSERGFLDLFPPHFFRSTMSAREQTIDVERPAKRSRTRSPPVQVPVASTSTLQDASNNNNKQHSTEERATEEEEPAVELEKEMTQEELDEKWRIYEMIAEEYHDSQLTNSPSNTVLCYRADQYSSTYL